MIRSEEGSFGQHLSANMKKWSDLVFDNFDWGQDRQNHRDRGRTVSNKDKSAELVSC